MYSHTRVPLAYPRRTGPKDRTHGRMSIVSLGCLGCLTLVASGGVPLVPDEPDQLEQTRIRRARRIKKNRPPLLSTAPLSQALVWGEMGTLRCCWVGNIGCVVRDGHDCLWLGRPGAVPVPPWGYYCTLLCHGTTTGSSALRSSQSGYRLFAVAIPVVIS